jgi:manganese/zinc/iron transport system permease protein
MNLFDAFSLIFTDYTLRTVALGAAILGLVSGTLGTFAVLRKQSLLGDTMSHAALPGVVLAFILTGTKAPLPLMLGAIAAGWLGTLLVLLVVNRTRIKQDSALGIVLAVFFGFGLVLLTWVQRQGAANQSGLDTFLFGRAAALIMRDVWTMAGVGAVAVVLVFLFWKEFKLLSFDPEFAASLGFPVRLLDIVLTTLIVVAVVIGLQTVGVVLMSAMIVAPASAARQWTDRLSTMVFLSAFFGALAGIVGALLSSLTRGLPTGPTVVLCISAIVFLSMIFAPNRGILWESLRRRRNRRQLRRRAVLETLYQMGIQHADPAHPHSLNAIRATVPGRGVLHTLTVLESEGLVQRVGEEQWALTAQGAAQIEPMIPDGDETTEPRGEGAMLR